MIKILFATTNKNKLSEIREIMTGVDCEIISLSEAGIDSQAEETGETFEENAEIKAQSCRLPGYITIADDSGLMIDYLDGAPGVYSSRYLGEDTSYEIKNRHILDEMKDVPDDERGARFVCAMCAVLPDGKLLETKGIIEGRIAYEPAGCGGFGYDPIFFVPELGMTTAELSAHEKNLISHRGRALRAMRELIAKVVEDESTGNK